MLIAQYPCGNISKNEYYFPESTALEAGTSVKLGGHLGYTWYKDSIYQPYTVRKRKILAYFPYV